MYSCDVKAEFVAAIIPVFSVTWSLMIINNVSYYYGCWKQFLLLIIFVETLYI